MKKVSDKVNKHDGMNKHDKLINKFKKLKI